MRAPFDLVPSSQLQSFLALTSAQLDFCFNFLLHLMSDAMRELDKNVGIRGNEIRCGLAVWRASYRCWRQNHESHFAQFNQAFSDGVVRLDAAVADQGAVSSLHHEFLAEGISFLTEFQQYGRKRLRRRRQSCPNPRIGSTSQGPSRIQPGGGRGDRLPICSASGCKVPGNAQRSTTPHPPQWQSPARPSRGRFGPSGFESHPKHLAVLLLMRTPTEAVRSPC